MRPPSLPTPLPASAGGATAESAAKPVAAPAAPGQVRRGRLTGTALALMGNTGITALLGLAFWILASRLYPPDVLGQDTGLIAAMMLLSSLSELSLHQAIPRLLPQVLRRRRLVVLGAYVTTGAVAVVLATAFVLIAPAVSPGFRFLGQDHVLQVLLVGSVVLWNVFALQDAVLAAVRKAIVVPVENGVFGVLKIALVVVFAGYGAGYGVSHGVVAAWLIAMVVVLPPISWLLFGRLLKAPTEAMRDTRALPLEDRGRVARYLGADYTATLLTQGSTSLLPVLVLATLGNAASAYFYVAFTIAGTLNAVALALGTSLVAEAAHDESALRGLARRALAWWGALVVPGILVLIVAVPLLLRPFGAVYVENSAPVLQLLLAGCIPQTLVTVYLGMERVRGRAGRVLRTQALAFVILLGALAVLVPARGLQGVGLAWLVAWTVAGLAVLPALLHVVGPGGGPGTVRRMVMARLRGLRSAGATGLADAAALGVTAAVVALAFTGGGGAGRVVLSLAFVTAVPGWSLVGRIRWMDGTARAALAVGISLSVAALGAAAMAWLQLWDPTALLLVLAGASGLLIVGRWVRRRRREPQPFEPTWVGEVEVSRPLRDLEVKGEGAPYRDARLLVRAHGRPLGFVTQPVDEGTIDAALLRRTIRQVLGDALATPQPARGSESGALISVVVCTRDRADSLGGTLEALQRLDHAHFEVVVVDNAPATEATAELFRARFAGDLRFRYVREARAGLSRARNRGVAEARGEIVAFTDDDVLVDAGWLDGVEAGFDRDPSVACVTGLVPPAQLDNEAQLYFDRRVDWGSNVRPRLFDRHEHRGGGALYPYAAGIFGAGANFAFERGFLLEIGGFDEALGAGSRARGGEDLDAFVRTINAGRALAYEPSAIVWHVHRGEIGQLRRQMFDYGLGLAAFVTKYVSSPRTAADIVSRTPAGLWRLATLWRTSQRSERSRGGLALVELLGMAAGPGAYVRGRRDARRRAA